MFAVIKTGGHQYTVKAGETFNVEKLIGQAGDKVVFNEVLMVGGSSPKLGAPFVDGAKVEGVIKEQVRDPKVIVFKYKRRKNYKRTRGHKQHKTVVEITKINA